MASVSIFKKRLAIPGGILTPSSDCEVNPVCCVSCNGDELPSFFYLTVHGLPIGCSNPPTSRCDICTPTGNEWRRALNNRSYKFKYSNSFNGTPSLLPGQTHIYVLDIPPISLPAPIDPVGPYYWMSLGEEDCGEPDNFKFYLEMILQIECFSDTGLGSKWTAFAKVYAANVTCTVDPPYTIDLASGYYIRSPVPVNDQALSEFEIATGAWLPGGPYGAFNVALSSYEFGGCDPSHLTLVDLTP